MDDRIRLVGAALWSEEEGAIRAALVEAGCFPWNGVWRGEALRCSVALFVRLARKRGWPRGDARAVMEWAMQNWRDGGPAALSAERKKRDRVSGPVLRFGGLVARVPKAELEIDLSGLRGRRPA